MQHGKSGIAGVVVNADHHGMPGTHRLLVQIGWTRRDWRGGLGSGNERKLRSYSKSGNKKGGK
jgi:hypothetical protein